MEGIRDQPRSDQIRPGQPSTDAVPSRCSVEKGVLNNLAKFTGKHVSEPIFNEVAGKNLKKKQETRRLLTSDLSIFLLEQLPASWLPFSRTHKEWRNMHQTITTHREL